MKKIVALLLCAIMIVAGAVVVSGYSIGDVVNKAVYTDIVASINGFPITSYNIDGYTAIVAEDLRNYGFEVIWDAAERSLNITRSESNNVSCSYMYPDVTRKKLGTKAYDVLYTDIRSYINNVPVKSYNIGGNTIVYFNDLAGFGGISYSEKERKLKLEIADGLQHNSYAGVKMYPGTYVPDASDIFETLQIKNFISDGAVANYTYSGWNGYEQRYEKVLNSFGYYKTKEEGKITYFENGAGYDIWIEEETGKNAEIYISGYKNGEYVLDTYLSGERYYKTNVPKFMSSGNIKVAFIQISYTNEKPDAIAVTYDGVSYSDVSKYERNLKNMGFYSYAMGDGSTAYFKSGMTDLCSLKLTGNRFDVVALIE